MSSGSMGRNDESTLFFDGSNLWFEDSRGWTCTILFVQIFLWLNFTNYSVIRQFDTEVGNMAIWQNWKWQKNPFRNMEKKNCFHLGKFLPFICHLFRKKKNCFNPLFNGREWEMKGFLAYFIKYISHLNEYWWSTYRETKRNCL